MRRVDYINGHDAWDGSLWYVDGKYVGHDDQYTIEDDVHGGATETIEFHHRVLKDDWEFDTDFDAMMVGNELLEAIEPWLKPETT